MNVEMWGGVGIDAPLVWVHLRLLADEIREAAPDTLDLTQGEHYLPPPIDVRIKHAQNVLKVGTHHQRSLLTGNGQSWKGGVNKCLRCSRYVQISVGKLQKMQTGVQMLTSASAILERTGLAEVGGCSEI